MLTIYSPLLLRPAAAPRTHSRPHGGPTTDINDANYCSYATCPAPSFALWKQQPPPTGDPSADQIVAGLNKDILLPYMVGVNHSLYSYPWENKSDVPFFRGRGASGANDHDHVIVRRGGDVVAYRPRQFLANYSAQHPEQLDVGLIDGAATTESGSPPRLVAAGPAPIRDHAKHKFVLALDGVTGSFRLTRLLHCDSVVLKQKSNWMEYMCAVVAFLWCWVSPKHRPAGWCLARRSAHASAN